MRKPFATLLFLMSLTSTAWSQDQFEDLYELSEDVRDVLTSSPELIPVETFELSKSEADRMKALAVLDDTFLKHFQEVGEECIKAELKERVEKRDYKIDAVVIASDKKFEQNAVGRFRTDDYMNEMGQIYISGNKKSEDIYTIDKLVLKYKEQNPGSEFDKLNISEREALLDKFAGTYLGTKLPSGLIMKEMAYQEMISKSGDWKKTLTLAKDKLSTDQKIALVSKIGGAFSDMYNYNRAADNKGSKGIFIDNKSLLDSVKNGTAGGVCRDIALAQTQYLEALGFKNNYVVSFKDKGGGHATVISTDPQTGKIIKFNYDDTTTMAKGSGTEALKQDHSLPEYGLSYKIYDTNGKPVTKVTTELAQMLRTGTNGDSDRIYNQKNYKIAKVSFEKNGVSGNLFTGQTSDGQTIYGASVIQVSNFGQYVKVNAGVAVAKVKGERAQVIVDQTNLYMLTNVEVTTPAVKHKAGETSAFLIFDNEVLISKNNETRKSSGEVSSAKQLDASTDIVVGVQNKYASADGKTKIDSKVYATFYPDFTHNAEAGKTRPAMNEMVVATGIEREVSADTKAKLDTAVIMKKYGTSMVVKAAIEDEKRNIKYKLGGATPLKKDMPTFLPGGEKRVFAGIEKRTGSMIFIVEVERNLDNKSNSVSVKGQGEF
jgi:archaellum component FlaF (FlaF/FlaG flagellin family)